MEYTKGEWIVASGEFTDKGVLYEVIMPKQEICIADAHLIAAAPDMYEALKYAERRLRQNGIVPVLVIKAIAKAEGR